MFWNAYKINRTRAAVTAYNRTLNQKRRELESWGLTDFSYLPKNTSVAEIQERVGEDINKWRRIVGYKNDKKRGRPSELDRVLKSVDPHALDWVEIKGVVTTKYSRDKAKRDIKALRRDRARAKKLRDEEFSYEDLTPAGKASLDINNDLGVDFGEPDDSYEDMDEQTYGRWHEEDASRKRDTESLSSKVDTYLGIWRNPLNFHSLQPGYQDLINAMEWMQKNKPDYLRGIFDSGTDEIQESFIYLSSKGPYQSISFQTRHNRAVAYVTRKAIEAGWKDYTQELYYVR